jgi:signal transduction histidine kinase
MGGDLLVSASLGGHLALAPVAFAVTEGPAHALIYANSLFRRLQSAGEIRIGPPNSGEPAKGADLTPLLDRVLRSADTVRDAVLDSQDRQGMSWSCTVWPVPPSGDIPGRLVIEVRDVALIEGARDRQRAIAERLLLAALRDQDIASQAVSASDRATYLAKASRDLSMSLDESETRDTVRRLTLPRPGTWCIVDVIEPNGAIQRLAVLHPDPAKQSQARMLEGPWPPQAIDESDAARVLRSKSPAVVTHESGAALLAVAHGPENLRILGEIGFGSLLVVPLIVRAKVQGAITFVSPEGDPHFTSEEIALAVDLAARCALALDNARLYREADALRLAAELANKSKSEFLGSMSHELRTPLNAIGGFADLIDMGIRGPVTDEQHVALARIKANQQHLLKLITEILDFVRAESGRMEYVYGEVSMKEAFQDVVQMLREAVGETDLKLKGPSCEVDVVAWADPDRVRQILLNLLTNAEKYAPDGTVTLTCSLVGDTVLAEVADTGPGIPPEKLEVIFEPFAQLTAGLQDREGGVGLGLAISRDLARAMKGELSVESTEGVGSRFTLSLPLARTAHRGSNALDTPAS